MKLNNELEYYINEKMSQYEDAYDIKVLCWWLRGTINMGMYRKNSDLDIAFLFQDKNKKCKGLHDLYKHGLDLWGVEIDEIVQTIQINNKNYYENKDSRLITLSSAHTRAGCNYYFGIYSAIGSEWVINSTSFLTDLEKNFLKIGEPVLMAKQLLGFVETRIEDIDFFGKLYLYDYLMSIWRLLLADKILSGGMPGDNNIIKLAKQSLDTDLYKDILYRLSQYRQSEEKKAIYVEDNLLNTFIVQKYGQMREILRAFEPKYKKNVYKEEMRKIKDYIQDM